WQSFDGVLQDQDLLNVTIEHNVAAPTTVEFVLEAGRYVTWWKAITLPTGNEIWTQDATKRATASVITSQLGPGSSLEFKKAKLLGVHTGMYRLGSLDQLQSGDRVTFRWIRDGSWQNRAYLESGAVIGAQFVQGRGYWVRPGAHFQYAIRA